ncbi:extracellular solute-binding protein [Aquibacillus koreensis]|uniref:Maltodextrin-binding protein n=1 Tax=Aquibacillus koreensis TaxID=279446 RepID=A0A9X3WMK2_9BACI|nr:extracellular solute-binding protein [Aquibacillus koreensis]MCT2536990.1 extracellular solute-binding protein [Aquibacillus koreensis]MDC3422817.1 extracellular solute-binding protein [Aquibacillus koreensis]
MKRKGSGVLSLVSFLAIFLLLIGCAPDRPESTDDGSGSNTSEESSEKPSELTIWANDEDKHLEAIENMAVDFEEQEGIKVNVVAKSMLDQLQELSLAGPEGNGPDVFLQAHDQIGNIVAQGLAAPLDLTEEEVMGYSDAARNAVTYQYDNETNYYGVPYAIETYGIFYNKDIVDNAPETIDDLKTLLEEKTNADEDQFGFLMKPNDLYFAYPFIKNYGGYIFGGETGEYDTSDIGLNNEGAVEGGKLFSTLFGKGLIPTSTTVDVVDGLFTAGQVGAVINGPWSIEGYKEQLGDSLGFAPFPQINDKPSSTLVGVKTWLVSYYSEHKDWAKELAVFITNEENQKYYFDTAGELPTNTNALEAIEDPIYSSFAEQIQYGVPMPSTPQMSQVWEPANNALQFIAEGKAVQSVLDEAVEQIETNIQASGSTE